MEIIYGGKIRWRKGQIKQKFGDLSVAGQTVHLETPCSQV